MVFHGRVFMSAPKTLTLRAIRLRACINNFKFETLLFTVLILRLPSDNGEFSKLFSKYYDTHILDNRYITRNTEILLSPRALSFHNVDEKACKKKQTH